MSELAISMLGSAQDLQQHPDKLAALEGLGVREMILFMAGASPDDTMRDIEAAARALKI